MWHTVADKGILTHMRVGLGGLLRRGRGSLLGLGGSGGWQAWRGSGGPGNWHRAVDTTPARVTDTGVDIGTFLKRGKQ